MPLEKRTARAILRDTEKAIQGTTPYGGLTPEQRAEKLEYVYSSRLPKIMSAFYRSDPAHLEVWESRYASDVPFLLALLEDMADAAQALSDRIDRMGNPNHAEAQQRLRAVLAALPGQKAK